MIRRSIILSVLALIALTDAMAEVNFSIRYYDKSIYYSDGEIHLKLILNNPIDSGTEDLTFYISDDPRHSFGFDLRSLTGEPMPLAVGFSSALNDARPYRVVHLAPGQEISITVPLNEWVDLSAPGQYRLTGFFFPRLRGRGLPALQAESVLDLTILPQTERRWEDELDEEIRLALVDRRLDPWSVVRETIENRSLERFNRAMLYLDMESLARLSVPHKDATNFEDTLLDGSWDDIPGFEHPVVDFELESSQVYVHEATVRVRTSYEPFGERFERSLRFYLHNPDGYWTIRRVEAVSFGDIDPEGYGRLDLSPPEVVAELLNAVVRGDWEIALRYYDTADLVRNLPEYIDTWNDMSATEHRRAVDGYRRLLLAGELEDNQVPLTDIEDWSITRVNYTDTQGSVTVENTKVHTDTASGPLSQRSIYTFRLEKTVGENARWQVVRYDASIIRR